MTRPKISAAAPRIPAISQTIVQSKPLFSSSGFGSPGSVGTFNVPGDWLPRLASGEAGGIGVGVDASTPYMRFDGPEFILTVDWERTA